MSFKIFENTPGTKQKEQTVVLLHGFVSSQLYWKRLIPYIQNAGYKVVTIDLLGFGNSRNIPTNHYTYESHVAHIEKCLTNAEIPVPFLLIGHSMGALLSAQYCAKHPEHIRNLVLLHPPIYNSVEQARQTLYTSSTLYKFLLTSRFRKLGWGILKFMPTGIANHQGKGREGSLENVILRDDNLYLLTNPSVKTLLIIGEKDRQIYVKNLREITISKNVSIDIVDTGHHSARSDTQMISEKIIAFLTETKLID